MEGVDLPGSPVRRTPSISCVAREWGTPYNEKTGN